MNHNRDEETIQAALADAANIRPYFQPILALDRRTIIGYEVLGRIQCGETVQSLGPFFTNPHVSPDEQLRVDLQIRRKAFQALGDSHQKSKLFINIKPSWLDHSLRNQEDLLSWNMVDQYNVDPSQIVIEITEDAFKGSTKLLDRLVEKYREKGCLIAIDDIGTGFSNMDRIVEMKPDIIKADIYMMKKSATNYSYYGVLLAFSILAEQIGASFLIEGVETEDDLRRAIAVGARYVQGYLFSPAMSDFQTGAQYTETIDRGMTSYRVRLLKEEQLWEKLCEQIMSDLRLPLRPCLYLGSSFSEQEANRSADHYIKELLPDLSGPCVCVYICDENGQQISSNYERVTDAKWVVNDLFNGVNWSWRPNFISSLLACKGKRKAYLSRMYVDLATHQNTRTLSTLLDNGTIFMVDINVDEAVEMFRVQGFLTHM
ncbi:MAG: EAL domain-containing protein [Sporolactobacillus sp.]